LQEHKQQFTSNSDFNITGLFQAIQANDRNAVTKIIQNNRDIVYERDYYGNTPLIFAVKQKSPDMAMFLLSCGAEINGTDHSGNTPLHWAVNMGSKEMIELLITNGASVNQGDNWNKTPLVLAKEKGNREIIELLGKQGATSQNYQQSMIDAIGQGNYEMVKQLLSEGVDVNTRVPNGCSLIHFAADYGHVNIATLLLEKGANVNDTAPASRLTPLHAAARGGHMAMVKFLIEKGANPTLKNYQDRTPADFARSRGFKEISEYLDNEQSKNISK
jgi:ankyrin repeat protein